MPPKRRRRFQGLYYHSTPPKVIPMNGQTTNQNGRKRREVDDFSVKLSTIRIWMHEKDIGKLTRILWAGQGNRLRQQASTNPKVKRFLSAVPYVMNAIKEVHQSVIDNSLETLQAKLEPPVPPALITCKDANGLNVMHKAAGLGHAKILEYLIGIWPDGANETDITGKTPLHWAASAKNNMRCYTLLSQACCDEEVLDYKMKSPSYYRHKPHEIERAFLVYVPEAPRVSADILTDWEALSDDAGDSKKPDIKIPDTNGHERATDDSIENTSELDLIDGASANDEEEMSKEDGAITQAATVDVEPEGDDETAPNEENNTKKLKHTTPTTMQGEGEKAEKEYSTKNDEDGEQIDNDAKEFQQQQGERPGEEAAEPGEVSNGSAIINDEKTTEENVEQTEHEEENGVLVEDEMGEETDTQKLLDTQGMDMDVFSDANESTLETQNELAEEKTKIDIDQSEANITGSGTDKTDGESNSQESDREATPIEVKGSQVEKLMATEDDTIEKVVDVKQEKGDYINSHKKDEEAIAITTNANEFVAKEVEFHEKEIKDEDIAKVDSSAANKLLEGETSQTTEKVSPTRDNQGNGSSSAKTRTRDQEIGEDISIIKNDTNEQQAPIDEDEIIIKNAKDDLNNNKTPRKNEGSAEETNGATEPEIQSSEDDATDANGREEDDEEDEDEAPDPDLDAEDSEPEEEAEASDNADLAPTPIAATELNGNGLQEGESPTSSLAIEGFVQGESEDFTVQSQSAAYVDEETRIQQIIASGDMEQLAQIVLNGDGGKLLNMQTPEQEIQAFLNNVPNYMNKIRRVHEAAREGSLLSLQQALDRRKFAIAKDEISANGATPLHVGVLFGHSDIVRYLAARFPETTTTTDNDGRTALHYAATIKDNGHFYNVLTQLGANPKAVDKLGNTPEFYLDTERSKDILSYRQLLSNFGAENLEAELLSDQGEAQHQSFQSNPIFKTEQGKYLANNLADPLIAALTEIASKRPEDPIAFLTTYLQTYMHTRNPNAETVAPSTSGKTNSTAMINSNSPPMHKANGNGNRAVSSKPDIEEDRLSTAEEDEIAPMPDDRDEHGQSMLHFASARSHRRGALLHLIEESNIDISHRDELYRTARDVSLQANQPANAKEIDRYVLSFAVIGDVKPFENLAIAGYDHIIDVVDDNGKTITDIANERGHDELVEFFANLRPLEEKREELHQMIRENQLQRVKEITQAANAKWLIKAKNYYGRTALHIAVLKEFDQIVEHIVDLCPEALKIGDNLERTPLHHAMGTNAIETLSRILIQKGAKRTSKDLKGRQPSYYFMNKAEILRLQEEEDESR